MVPSQVPRKGIRSISSKKNEKVSDTFLAISPLIMVRFLKIKICSTQQIVLYKSSRPTEG